MRLTMSERRAVVKAFSKQYRSGSKKCKGEILDRFVSVTGYNRAYGARLLRNPGRKIRIGRSILIGDATKKKKRRRGSCHYDENVKKELICLCTMLDFISSKRMAPALPGLISALDHQGELDVDENTRQKLLSDSASTIDRLLSETRKRSTLRCNSRTKPGSLLKHQIPIRTYSDWDDACP